MNTFRITMSSKSKFLNGGRVEYVKGNFAVDVYDDEIYYNKEFPRVMFFHRTDLDRKPVSTHCRSDRRGTSKSHPKTS